MKINTSLLFSFFILILFVSCEKDLNLELYSSDKELVVDGRIENDQVPYVTLTKSLGFFSKINLNALEYIKNATITVSDVQTNVSVNLIAYSIDTTIENTQYSFTVYAPNLSDPVAMNFKGEVDHTYKLSITLDGKQHEAYTKIPATTGLDSVWLEPVPGKETKYSTFKGIYNDPDTIGNSVFIETLNKRYEKDSIPEIYYRPFQYVLNDAIINGLTLPVTFDIGYNRFQPPNDDFENLGFLKKGDTVTLKWSAIDKNVFNFFEKLTFSENSVGNPFSTPIKVQGNVTNAIGVWAGYNHNYYTLIDSL